MLVEGFLSIVSVVRVNLNPVYADFINAHRIEKIKEYDHRLNKEGRAVFGLLSILIIVSYSGFAYIFKPDYFEGLLSLVVLLLGTNIAVPQIIKANRNGLHGYPFADTQITFIGVFSNFVLDFLLASRLGMIGVAVGTACSYCIFAWIMERSIRRRYEKGL